jgi:4-cresol dehydrogenase (hydroxylating)
VAHIVAVANAERIPLYPFSTGLNWGLGSKLPVVDDCVLVDLSCMKRIVRVDEDFGYAIIEPGGTQAALADHLAAHHPALSVNFTGSFVHTSIVGNVLDRGDGAYARIHDLLGVRGILGSGERFQVGGSWAAVEASLPSHHIRHTAGPDLTGLFSQSSFGIVTQMAFRLLLKPERLWIFWGSAADEKLEEVVDALGRLGRRGVIDLGRVNVGYENRFVQARDTLTRAATSETDAPAWNFYVTIGGTPRVTDVLLAEVRDGLAPLCHATGATCARPDHDLRSDLPPFLQPLVKPLLGTPDAESIKIIYTLTGTPLPQDDLDVDPDRTPFGMKCYIPVVPFPRNPRSPGGRHRIRRTRQHGSQEREAVVLRRRPHAHHHPFPLRRSGPGTAGGALRGCAMEADDRGRVPTLSRGHRPDGAADGA